jgi:perosamine synthetase
VSEEPRRARIRVAGPSVTQREVDYVAEAARHGWYENAELYHRRFEAAFAGYVGVPYALALPSCTSAIHLSLLALGVGPGDEVVVPDITWTATAAPVVYVGATPVFADVDRETWCLTASSLEECVSRRTRAVIPVDLYGGMPDMDAIREISDRAGIAVIEDAAQAIGAQYRGAPAGSFGDVGVFSFHGTKTLTTGEGGMLVSSREELVRRADFLATLGCRPVERTFFCTEVGQKYKMSNLQAAFGLAQLERIDELVGAKRRIFSWYRDALQGVAGVTLNAASAGVLNSYWMTTAVVDPELGLEKERLIEELKTRGVDSRPFFYPLSSIPAYYDSPDAARARDRNAVSYSLSGFGINLPSALDLTRESVEYVSACLREILAGAR